MEQQELEERKYQIEIIKIKNLLKNVPKLSYDELVSLGYDPEIVQKILEDPTKTIEELVKKQPTLSDMFYEVKRTLAYYLDHSEEKLHFLAIVVLSSYFYNEFPTYPIIHFNAIKGAAKTRTSKLVNYLMCNGTGRITNSMTESTFFRHPNGVPMSIDECESIGSKENSTLRELMNALYKKGSSVQRQKKVKDKEGERYETETFTNRYPLTISNINGLEEVLEDRSFSIVLEKSDKVEFVNLIEDWEERPEINEIKRTLKGLVSFSVMTLRKKMYIRDWNNFVKNYTILHIYTNNIQQHNITAEEKEEEEKRAFFKQMMDSGITGRNFELAFPFLITSKLISDEVFDKTLQIMKEFTMEKKEIEYAESRDVVLYQFVSKRSSTLSFNSIKSLTIDFKIFLGDNDEWINEKWLGRALKRLDLISQSRREASGRFVILNVAKAKEKVKMFGGVTNVEAE